MKLIKRKTFLSSFEFENEKKRKRDHKKAEAKEKSRGQRIRKREKQKQRKAETLKFEEQWMPTSKGRQMTRSPKVLSEHWIFSN